MAPTTDTEERGRVVTRLRALRVNRISFVAAGDDPLAKVVIWKSKPDPPAPAEMTFAERLAETRELAERRRQDHVTETMRRAFDALARRNEEEEAVEMAKTDARLDALERGGGRVSKAADLAARLRQLAEKDLDRRPVDERGRARTLEQALLSVTGTREGIKLQKALRQEGSAGSFAFAKAFDVDSPQPEPEPTQTGGEQTLRRLAEEYRKAHSTAGEPISKEQALARIVETPEGRAAYAAHREEVASR